MIAQPLQTGARFLRHSDVCLPASESLDAETLSRLSAPPLFNGCIPGRVWGFNFG